VLEGVADGGAGAAVLRDASTVLAGVRKAKSEAKTSMRTEVPLVEVTGPAEAVDRVRLAAGDLAATGHIAELRFTPGGDALAVRVSLAP
jgi:valyl-tRNA synthetase